MKVLFLGDGYPVSKDAGAILYRRILQLYGIEHFCYYGVGYKTKLQWPKEFTNMPKSFSSLRLWPRSRFAKYLKRIPLLEELYYFIMIHIVQRKINNFAQKNQVELIIAVLRADVLAIINRIDHKYPFLGYISDTVEAEFTDKPKIFNYKSKEYVEAIRRANGIYVASEAMNKYITNTYSKKTSILRLGYEPNINKQKTSRTECKEFKIFFAGSIYARTELEQFIAALSSFNDKHPNCNISLTTASPYNIKNQGEGLNISNLGWLNEIDLTSVMKDSDLGYVPYKFDKNHKTHMEYAFPSKAGFYISAGLPLFFHGPEYSSMAEFFKIYQCGIHCASMNINDIMSALEKIIFDSEFYSRCHVESIRAFKNEFSLTVLENNLNKLINSSL